MERDDRYYMQRCLELAAKGLGSTQTNPLVGSVVVKNGEIIGEGFHEKFGEAHAEVNAIRNVLNENDLKDSTLYVNLEPCAHFGKTPPCSNLIIEKHIPRVVIGALDTFSEVNGKGIERMRAAGIDVKVGVLETECRELNKRFYTHVEKKRPYIMLKWAQSSDGFIDPARSGDQKGIHWITQPETKKLTHQWRSEESAILVGRNTVLVDNPSLTTRAVNGRNPIRVILDPNGTLIKDYAVFNSEARTLHLVKKRNPALETEQHELPAFTLEEILSLLLREGISSLIVEGGAYTLHQFLEQNLWDEARILTGIAEIKKGSKAPTVNGEIQADFMFGRDRVQIYRNRL